MTSISPDVTIETAKAPSARHRIMAGFIGNVIEWYDFALYGYLAGVLAPVFFPTDDPAAGLIATYGIFAAGFLMRPLGAAIFGFFGDRYGRARAMQVSVTMMVLPTLALGLLPSYAQVGILAPILLVVVRLVQGLSVGGEFSSSVTWLVETAPQGKRGLVGSWANIGSMTGSLLGVGAASLVTTFCEPDLLLDWGWRLPFLAGALMGLLAIWIRRNLHESKRFEQHHENRSDTSPLLQAFTTNRHETLLALGFAAGYGACFYIVFVYLPQWLTETNLLDRATALTLNTAMTLFIIPLMPLFAIVGDRWISRRSWILIALSVLSLSAWPLYLWMQHSDGSLFSILMTHVILFSLMAVPLGSGPALFVEMFPEEDRLSGYSIAFNVGLGIFGGLTPMINSSLIATTGTNMIPAYYTVLMAAAAVLILSFTPDRSRAPLR
ncbi:MFS transporter [Sneathiella limimaris]|uniref:MFS transporter n=1 Tax=Sneathiella limimaris TaxID=1964213 RepID=UPI0019CF9756|nr:MFS transporter [Sneathiella limimaris]